MKMQEKGGGCGLLHGKWLVSSSFVECGVADATRLADATLAASQRQSVATTLADP